MKHLLSHPFGPPQTLYRTRDASLSRLPRALDVAAVDSKRPPHPPPRAHARNRDRNDLAQEGKEPKKGGVAAQPDLVLQVARWCREPLR